MCARIVSGHNKSSMHAINSMDATRTPGGLLVGYCGCLPALILIWRGAPSHPEQSRGKGGGQASLSRPAPARVSRGCEPPPYADAPRSAEPYRNGAFAPR